MWCVNGSVGLYKTVYGHLLTDYPQPVVGHYDALGLWQTDLPVVLLKANEHTLIVLAQSALTYGFIAQSGVCSYCDASQYEVIVVCQNYIGEDACVDCLTERLDIVIRTDNLYFVPGKEYGIASWHVDALSASNNGRHHYASFVCQIELAQALTCQGAVHGYLYYSEVDVVGKQLVGVGRGSFA